MRRLVGDFIINIGFVKESNSERKIEAGEYMRYIKPLHNIVLMI